MRKFLTKDSAIKVTHAFVTSRLDYCNSLLYGISKSLSDRLQLVLNTAARIVTRTRVRNRTTPVLKSLHWLPIVQRCAFKIALLTFKILHGMAPSYLTDLIKYHFPSRNLRSECDIQLKVPKVKTSSGSRAFVVAAPSLWNSLPNNIHKYISQFFQGKTEDVSLRKCIWLTLFLPTFFVFIFYIFILCVLCAFDRIFVFGYRRPINAYLLLLFTNLTIINLSNIKSLNKF